MVTNFNYKELKIKYENWTVTSIAPMRSFNELYRFYKEGVYIYRYISTVCTEGCDKNEMFLKISNENFNKVSICIAIAYSLSLRIWNEFQRGFDKEKTYLCHFKIFNVNVRRMMENKGQLI